MCDVERSRADLIAELSELRQQVETLTAFNAGLEAYVRIIVHDLKHPLGLIIGYAEFLLQMYETQLDEEVHRDLNIIARRGHRMVNIIEEMLALVYVHDAQDLSLISLDMGAIVHRACERMSDIVERLRADIIISDTWPVALGRDFLLEEVWVNLLGYALRYDGTPREFRVMLGASLSDEHTVRFWVRDTARPLSDEERARFMMAWPESGHVKTQGKQFGLPVVRYIVEKLGGQVGIKPEPASGWGNEFFFTLPGVKEDE